MSGKRQASYTIDPTTFEQKQKQIDHLQQKLNNPSKINKQQRQFFKIKRPGQTTLNQSNSSKVTFKLNESQQIKPDDTTQNQEAEKKHQPLKNPFQNLFSNSNIFNGIGMFSNSTSLSLFSSNKSTQQSSKILVNSNSPSDTFVSSGQKRNIFQHKKDQPISNTLSLKNTQASIFQKNDEDQGSGDSAELQKQQDIEANPEKSEIKFDYGEGCPVLLIAKADKFKKNSGSLIQRVQLVIQREPDSKISYLSVRLSTTKTLILTAILVPGRSQVRHLLDRKENVEISAFIKAETGLSKCVLKFQFPSSDEGENTFKKVQELLSVSP